MSDPKDPLSVPISTFTSDFTINTTSALIAAHEATVGFAELPATASKTFLYTGNGLNVVPPIAPLLTLGVGKSASAHIIALASKAYSDKGYK